MCSMRLEEAERSRAAPRWPKEGGGSGANDKGRRLVVGGMAEEWGSGVGLDGGGHGLRPEEVGEQQRTAMALVADGMKHRSGIGGRCRGPRRRRWPEEGGGSNIKGRRRPWRCWSRRPGEPKARCAGLALLCVAALGVGRKGPREWRRVGIGGRFRFKISVGWALVG
jgi:hypothetical protein